MDRTWLKRRCEAFLSKKRNSSTLSVQDLAVSVYEILVSPRKDSEIESELFDLLGFESFELIQELLKKRNSFLDMISQISSVIIATPPPKKEKAVRFF